MNALSSAALSSEISFDIAFPLSVDQCLHRPMLIRHTNNRLINLERRLLPLSTVKLNPYYAAWDNSTKRFNCGISTLHYLTREKQTETIRVHRLTKLFHPMAASPKRASARTRSMRREVSRVWRRWVR